MITTRVVQGARSVHAAIIAIAACGLGAVIAFQPGRATALVGGVILATLAIMRQRRLLLVVAVLALILASGSWAPPRDSLYYGRFVVLAALAAAAVMVRSGRASTRTPFVPMFVALAAWTAATTIWSAHPSLTIQRSASWLLIVAVVLAHLRSAWSARTVVVGDITAVTTTVAVVVVAGLALYLAGVPIAHGSALQGLVENPNAAGMLGCFLVPLAIGLSSIASDRRVRRTWILVAGLAGLTVLLSESRGALLGVLAGLLFALGRSVTPATRRRVVVGVVVILLVAAPALVLPAIDSIRTKGDTGRADIWGVSYQLWLERPLSGWGFGTTERVLAPGIARLQRERSRFTGGLVHNTYLETLVEMGPVGLGLLLLVILAVLRCRPRRGDPLHAAVRGAFVAMLVFHATESGIMSAGAIAPLLIWVTAGATVALDLLPPRS